MRSPRSGGTRFRLFPSYAEGFAEPEVVELSLPPGMVGAGPADPWMYTIDPVDKTEPYDPPHYVPPYPGRVYPPARPAPDGNFDHIAVESEQFPAAHLYGTMRLTLDVWERYLRRRIAWWDASVYPRMELVTLVQWENAQSGPGFLETGRQITQRGRPAPYCLNYDIIAHETGHAILFSQIGVPRPERIAPPFLAFHESFADLVALIGVLHFGSVRTRLLEQTDGNLYAMNLLSRIGETSPTEQIRRADNTTTMDDVAGITMAADGTWIDPAGLGRNQHAIAEPLTGAIFDILVEIYQDGLVARGLIAPHRDLRGWTREDVAASMDHIRHESAGAFARFTQGFYAALEDARHVVGRCMAHVMLTVHPEGLTFGLVAARFLEAAAALGQAPNLAYLLDDFLWRGIDPRPFLALTIPPGSGRRRGEARGRLGGEARGRLGGEPRGWLDVRDPPNPSPYCACCDIGGLWHARRHMNHPHRARPG